MLYKTDLNGKDSDFNNNSHLTNWCKPLVGLNNFESDKNAATVESQLVLLGIISPEMFDRSFSDFISLNSFQLNKT